jgi:hypothetical protein
MSDELVDVIHRAKGAYPEAAHASSELLRLAKNLFQGQLQHLTKQHGDAFWQRAERLTGYSKALGGKPAEALIDYTMAYLKEQVRFLQTGEYSNTDFETVFRDVYDNPEVMEGFYLHGLMLTHAFWPIHFDMHEFFSREFLSRVPDEGTGAEYGFGHGLYLVEVLSHKPQTRARGYDISKYSIDYARKLLAHAGVQANRVEFGFADVRQPFDCPDGQLTWAVFAEIIEHIPDPHTALCELRRCMRRGAPLFATTVIDSNAIDHLFQFKDVAAVRDLLEQTGFEIAADRVLRVSDYGAKVRDPSVDVALVCLAK